MKRNIGRLPRLITMLCLLLCMVACKKNSSSDPGPSKPIVSSKGEPMGTAVQKEIGAAGGTITSADGMLTIVVPPGAIAANTQFGIQPITNTLHEKSSQTAFRLTPEGTTFSKPVEVRYQFTADQMKQTLPELITAAYQTAEGNWKAVTGRMNKDTRQYSFKTTHFSDWSVEGSIWLYANEKTVSFGDTSWIQVHGVQRLPENDLLSPLSGIKKIEFSLLQPTKGKVGIDESYTARGYFTPFRPQPNTSNMAEVSVRLSGQMIEVYDESLPGGSAVFDQLILLTTIEIANDVYMKGTFMGTPVDISTVVAVGNEAGIGITGQSGNLMINLNAFAQTTGYYPCGAAFAFGKSQITVTSSVGPIPKTYSTTYEDCGPPVTLKYATAGVSIDEWGAINKIVKGSCVGAIYTPDGTTPDGCTKYKSHSISLEFRTIRSL